MQANRIVEAFKVLKNGGSSLLSGAKVPPIETLLSQGGKERLHGRIVPTSGGATHAHLNVHFSQCCLRVLTGEFASAIGVMQEPCIEVAACHNHTKSHVHQHRIFVRSQSPPNNHARVQVHNRGKIQPALARFHRFGICDPLLIGLLAAELPIERIGGKASSRVALRCWLAASVCLSASPNWRITRATRLRNVFQPRSCSTTRMRGLP